MTFVRKLSKHEFWSLDFFLKPSYSRIHLLSYGTSQIDLKSCWLTQDSLEQDPFSIFLKFI